MLSPKVIFALALIAYALTRLPDKYRPVWTHRLDSRRRLIVMVAMVMAVLILLTPEFTALGLLGDSAFFDVLVLALTCHLQVYGARTWRIVVAVFSTMNKFLQWRLYQMALALLLMFEPAVSAIRKLTHHWFS